MSLAAKSASFQAEIWILSALGRKPCSLLTAHGETCVPPAPPGVMGSVPKSLNATDGATGEA